MKTRLSATQTQKHPGVANSQVNRGVEEDTLVSNGAMFGAFGGLAFVPVAGPSAISAGSLIGALGGWFIGVTRDTIHFLNDLREQYQQRANQRNEQVAALKKELQQSNTELNQLKRTNEELITNLKGSQNTIAELKEELNSVKSSLALVHQLLAAQAQRQAVPQTHESSPRLTELQQRGNGSTSERPVVEELKMAERSSGSWSDLGTPKSHSDAGSSCDFDMVAPTPSAISPLATPPLASEVNSVSAAQPSQTGIFSDVRQGNDQVLSRGDKELPNLVPKK